MKTERWMNDERFVNERWMNYERTLNALWTVNASERWTVNAKLWTMNAWTHDERTLNARWANGERTQKWESRTFQGLYISIYIMNCKESTLVMPHCMMYFINYNDIPCTKWYCDDMIHGSLDFQGDI